MGVDTVAASMRAGSRAVSTPAPQWQDFAARRLDFTDPGGDNGA
jgi:hypothetical protein